MIRSVVRILKYVWYEAAFWVSWFTFTLAFSLRIEGRRRIPPRGPVIIIANHQSFLDPILVGVSSWRHLSYLARKTLFRNPLFALLIRSVNAVPIDQEGVGKEGLRLILELLEQGRAIVIYPEGTRSPDGTMQPLQPGVHLLIRRAKAPVVPLGIAGAYQALPMHQALPTLSPLFLPAGPSTIAVSVGKPLDGARLAELSREALLAELTTELQKVQLRAEELRRKR